MNNMANDSGFIITRKYLYKIVADHFSLIDEYLLLKQNREFIINIFIDSSNIAGLLESEIKEARDHSLSSFNDLWGNIIEEIKVESFREYIDASIREKVFNKINNSSNHSFKMIVVSIFKEIAFYQNRLIEKNFASPWFRFLDSTTNNSAPQTFLSYAYYDKGISIGLFIYFLLNGGFLYVNWMWSGTNPAHITKQQLDLELKRSNQFLFLRTLNSELDYYGNSHIRQWCSWEIGNYYTKNKSRKFYLNFYGETSKNDLLSTFSIFRYVKDGIIYN